ncbi:hypothetical protein CDL15_Pgr000083 [Punica granatum]|uniref:Peptidase C1A papain C-terminal domain-containing protein n=1 Tax=Punica granatum TaxID=22663 RepID=A0A218Y213_PUNGR|nr:hypothetical protein CDL15_Pgr000083 [Punica granatum]
MEDFNRARNTSFRLGLNQFSDLTTEEFQATYTITKVTPRTSINTKGSFRVSDDASVPESVNWVEAGVATDVRNQGTCGMMLLGIRSSSRDRIDYKFRADELLDLSEQQLLDSVTDAGCKGMTMVQAYHEADLLRAVAQQPVSVGITASDLLRAYKDGIFCSTDCRNVQNHAVTIVVYVMGAFGQADYAA